MHGMSSFTSPAMNAGIVGDASHLNQAFLAFSRVDGIARANIASFEAWHGLGASVSFDIATVSGAFRRTTNWRDAGRQAGLPLTLVAGARFVQGRTSMELRKLV